MDYDYIKVGSDLLRISRGEWRGLERSKRLSPRDPWRETTSSQKNGWAANRATHGALSVISPFTSPSRGAQRALIDCVLNYVFTCVPDKLPWPEVALKSRATYAIEHRASELPLIVARIVSASIVASRRLILPLLRPRASFETASRRGQYLLPLVECT